MIDALEITETDDRDIWNDKCGQLPALEESGRKKGKRGKMNNPIRKMRASRSMDGEDEYSSSDDGDRVKSLKASDNPRPMKAHFSADTVDRRKKKQIKYRKHKHQYTKSLDDDEKAVDKKRSAATQDNDDAAMSGLNTSVPRTPPKKKEPPSLKQVDLESIARLLN